MMNHHKTPQPKISRKIRACQECQTRKVKCRIEPGDSSCARCRKSGLSCIFNRSLQTMLEDDYEWKRAMEEHATQLQSAIFSIRQQLEMLPPEKLYPGPQTLESNDLLYATTPYSLASGCQDVHSGISLSQVNTPASICLAGFGDDTISTPRTSPPQVASVRSACTNIPDQIDANTEAAFDSISKGKISLQDAEDMFRRFCTLLDQYPWCRAALVHDSLTLVRKSSPLLLAVIIAVAALHMPGKEELFDVAYTEVLALVCESMFAGQHGLDDIRALCVGSLWLSDISWKLSDHAVRIATEMNIRKSVTKAISGQVEHSERARVWYLLYVCDRQSSFAYSRPHIVPDDTAISSYKMFLRLHGTHLDLHLHSQVALYHLLGRVHQQYGNDAGLALSDAEFSDLHGWNVEIDNWRTEWEAQLGSNKSTPVCSPQDLYSPQGIYMQWNFSKLQVNLLALRGLSPEEAHLISDQRRHFINLAIAHACETFQFVLNRGSSEKFMVRAELYLHTMLTNAAAFLLRVRAVWMFARLNLDPDLVVSLVGGSIQLLGQTKGSQRHVASFVTNGLASMLSQFKELQKLERDQRPTWADTSVQPGWESWDYNNWLTFEAGLNTINNGMHACNAEQGYFATSVYV